MCSDGSETTKNQEQITKYSAFVLVDSCWLVLVECYGDWAAKAVPESTRERLALPVHASVCEGARKLVTISPQLAAIVCALEVPEHLLPVLEMEIVNIDIDDLEESNG